MQEHKYFPTDPFSIKSFVHRNSRKTPEQAKAFTEFWPDYGLSLHNGLIDYKKVFKRSAPHFLEIGFGFGQSLLALAKAYPKINFIGVETHQPGIGSLLLGAQSANITNLRVYYADAVLVLLHGIPENSLDGIQLFFPDPWPKRRHHRRRLIQPEFIEVLAKKLSLRGVLHLATDWPDYAQYMMNILSKTENFINLAGPGQFADRSFLRPIETKFEQRAKRAGRVIWELQFKRNSSASS